jgi:hypothetical protein
MASHVLAFLAAVESDVIVQFTNDRGLVKLSDGGVYQHFVNPIRAQQPTAAKSSLTVTFPQIIVEPRNPL